MPALRACVECGRPSDQARCPTHRRGTTTQRGYGWQHQQTRADAVRHLDPTAPCPRCGQPLGDNPDALDLGHTDDRTGYTGLEHLNCNRGKRTH